MLCAGASDAQHADELQQQLYEQVDNLTAAVKALEAERDNAQHVAAPVPNLAFPGHMLSYPHNSFATS